MSTNTTCNPISIAGTILYFQITVEFCRPQKTRNTGGTTFTMRNRSENDPSAIRPHTRPSCNRCTAEIDQRGSGRVFVWKNTTQETVSHPSHRRSRSWTFGAYFVGKKYMVSCSCYLSKTDFVLDFLQNTIGNSPTRTTYNPFAVRERS